ncbi:MAG: adenine phosphoribosyltransferase [Planctomycetota bacterium]|nr:adenine phosphoribosyltransferase [Planctomycetota bacterium]MDA1114277.1 adenine phosphoribosyltransferase [Planctomycetota bacterium]
MNTDFQPRLQYTDFLRDIPDYPKPGIVFKDITPLLQDAEAFATCIDDLADLAHGFKATHIAGMESRGFLFGAPLAIKMGLGFLPIRKPGKLPWKTFAESYDLEYGQDTLEIHTDASAAGERVLLVDDLLATGGTAGASVKLVRRTGAEVVGCLFVVELGFLGGRKMLHGLDSRSLVNLAD